MGEQVFICLNGLPFEVNNNNINNNNNNNNNRYTGYSKLLIHNRNMQ